MSDIDVVNNTPTPETVPSVEIQNLSSYLSNVSKEAPKLKLSIFPSVVRDCTTIFIEYKKMKIEDKQFTKKCMIINRYLENQSSNQELGKKLNHEQIMYEIETYRTTEINKSNVKRDIAIAQIENNTRTALEEIRSKERIQITELKANYDLKKREQENEFYKFKKALKEEARRFDKQYNIALNEQSSRHAFIEELRNICKYINKKL